MVVITSKTNPIIKYAIQLKDKHGVKNSGECLVESEKVVRELSDLHKLSTILVDNAKADKYAYILDNFDGKVVYISTSICNYIADSTTPSGIFGFAKISFAKSDIVSGNAIVLDSIQDPANLGAIIRSALAFGFKDIYLINSVFPYTYKAIRASMGYVFSVRIHEISYSDLARLHSENEFHLLVADADGTPIDKYDVKGNVALVIGNEGNGISDNIIKMNIDTVSIPMQNGVESLNASISASILMHYISNIRS